MKNIFISFLLIFRISLALCNDIPTVSLSQITPEGGVGYSPTTFIEEDNQGFIWFGTNNGLYFYNSHEIIRYSHNQNDSLTIPSNRINEIYNDFSGNIWIATEDGLCSYNRKSDNFSTYLLKDQFNNIAGKNINSFFQAKDSTFWVANENGFGTLDIESNTLTYKTIDDKLSKVRIITCDDNGTIWVLFADGSIYYQTEGSNSYKYFAKGLTSIISSVLIDTNHIWIAYRNNGLLCLNIDGSQKAYFSNETSDKTTLPSNQVRSLVKVGDKQIWAGTYNGIAVIEDFKIVSVINEDRYAELPNHSIWSLFKDSQENIWIGTYHGGLCFHSSYNNSFFHYTQSNSKNSLSYNVVSSFIQVPNQNTLIVGTEDGTLNYLSPKENSIKKIPVTVNNEGVKNIKSLAIDKNGTLWVGTYENGILYQEHEELPFKKLQTPFSNNYQALDILVTESGLWVSKYPQGVYFYNFKTKQFSNYRHNPLDINSISSDDVRQIIEDKKGNIWFATQTGLNLLEKGSDKFIHYFHNKNKSNSISSDFIYAIHEDKEGFLWIGTNGQGLNKFNPKTDSVEYFTMKDGLPDNEIFSILEDEYSNLWLATNQGIAMFNTKTNKVQSFNSAKGIQNNSFNPNTSLASANGELYFGGTNGFIQFKPKEMSTNPIPPNTILTQFHINNKLVLPDNQMDILDEIIGETEKIYLDHTQNSFSFHFIANNYIDPDKNKYKYRLLGFNKEWTETDINRAVFTNIPPDKYIFEVKAANNNGIWKEKPTQIEIFISPPLWRTWYANLSYYVFVTLIVLFFRKQLLDRQNLRNAVELEKVKRESEEQMNQTKLQFFTNISHEFRTPLTLINGPVNRLLKKNCNQKMSEKQFTIIKNNTDRLLRLVNQILDFRKMNSGTLKLNSVHADIVLFCKDIFTCFEDHAHNRNFTYEFKSDIPSLKMDFDMDKLDKILFNILSNSFKYTPNGGSIVLELQNNKKSASNIVGKTFIIGDNINDDFVEIRVIDTGKGIPAENLSRIFDRFYQLDNNSTQGTGIGLALSKNYIHLFKGQLKIDSSENKGTEFSIYLPQHQPESVIQNKTHQVIPPPIPIIQTNNGEAIIAAEKADIDKEKSSNQEALILIAEDNIELLDYLGDVLQEHFRVAKTQNGREAYDQTHSLFPDLIISDIMMPEMDGIELCEKLKKDIRTSHIPIILLTALESVQDRISGLNTGADSYMSKPFDDDLLITQINNLLNSRKVLRESFNSEKTEVQYKYKDLDMDKKLLLNAIKIIDLNLTDENFSVDDLASKLNLSRTHLYRKLKSLTNQSATEFIRYNRLKHAVKLMKENELSLSEIGYAVGFNSPNYFATSFRKQYGKSPSDFIKEDLDL